VSEVGFGLWTISTAWRGKFTEGEAVALMHKAFDLAVTLFDAADTYGISLNVFVNQEIAAVVTAADFDDAVGFAP
jgi:aryl-alcohol dehydrogenase-like predicted oxidoreductase